MTAVTLRPARPDRTDGRAFAHYVDTAADGLFTTMLGSARDRVIADAFPVPGHDLSFEHVVVAEIDGDTVGMSSSYSADEHRRASQRPVARAAGWRTARLVAVAAVLWPVLRFMDRLPEGDHYLQAVAVDEARRGHGVGSRLIDEVMARARERGDVRLVLDVAVDNPGARRLYERLGMTVEATSPPALLPGARVHRMVTTL